MKRIIGVECWADKYFFERLLQSQQLIRKEKNKSQVVKSVVERAKDNFSIGIIDHDNEEIKLFLKNIEIDERFFICQEIEIIKLKNSHQYLFQLLPNEFENWIARFIEIECRKKLSDFGYNNVKEFTTECKVHEDKLLRNQKFKKLIDFVLGNYINTDNYIKKMKNALNYLIKNYYQIDIDTLKKL